MKGYLSRDEEVALIERLTSGDETAVDELIAGLAPLIPMYFKPFLEDTRIDAMGVGYEAIVRVIERLPTLNLQCRLVTYAKRAIYNALCDATERQKGEVERARKAIFRFASQSERDEREVERALLLEMAEELAPRPPYVHGDDERFFRMSPRQCVRFDARRVRREVAWDAIAELTKTERSLLVYRRAGFSDREIARRIGIDRRRVQASYEDAVFRLRAILGPVWVKYFSR